MCGSKTYLGLSVRISVLQLMYGSETYLKFVCAELFDIMIMLLKEDTTIYVSHSSNVRIIIISYECGVGIIFLWIAELVVSSYELRSW